MRSRAELMSGAGLMVVATMCLALLGTLGTVCFLAATGQDVPDALDRIVQGLLIGVPALLAKTYKDGKDAEKPTEVEVMNPPSNPVPIESDKPAFEPMP